MNRKIRAGLVLLIFITLVFAVSAAWAKGDLFITSTNQADVNMRSGPSKDHRVVATLGSGTKVTLISKEGDWAKISVNGTEGYVMTIFLSEKDPAKNDDQKNSEGYIQSPNSMPVNLREGPGRSTKVTGTLVTGTEVSLLGKEGDWTKVKVKTDGQTGYVLTSYIVSQNPYSSRNGSKTTYPTVYIVSDNGGAVNIRETPDGKPVAQVPSGTEATLVNPGSVWSKVEVDGASGYVKNEYISNEPVRGDAEDDNDKTKIMYVKSTNSKPVNMRKENSRSSEVIGELVTGTVVEVLSADASWSQVRVNGQKGYVMNAYLVSEMSSAMTSSKSYKAYVTTPNQGTVRMRNGAGTGYGVVTTLKYGTEVTVLAQVKDWARVRCGEWEGYINMKYLTNKKP